MAGAAESNDRQKVLIQALLEIKELRAKLEAAERARGEPIAIIGMACRFPGGANDPESYWELLRDGREGISVVPPDRWDADAFYDPDPDAPGKMYTRHGGFLQDVDIRRFDAPFFNISPREAAGMDPQQRILLEVAWEALERAGQAPDRLAGSRTGVFVGVVGSEYASIQLAQGIALEDLDVHSITGNVLSIIAGRISYALGLQGPSIALDTACSSSLVAAHLAAQSLRSGECDLALIGGVNLMLSPVSIVGLSKMRAVAADGRCKTFDASADGYGRSEGCGIAVLKRLSDAQRDGDPVLAVLLGSAVNQDGPSSGLTVPNGPAQQAVIRQALANARLSPHDIGYIEAHGTGTPLGDPIEIQALTEVLGQGRPKDQPLAIGSAKANIGHLESAAGVAGLIKVVLSLQHGELPPHPRLQQLNPRIALDPIPAVIPTRREPWRPINGRRIAGVSSFGFSGTNAHVILADAPPAERVLGQQERPLHLLSLSAKSPAALDALAASYARHLAEHPEQPFADVCFTANVGRALFPHRLAVVAADAAQARAELEDALGARLRDDWRRGQVKSSRPPKIAFLCTGQGAQYLGMGQQLYQTQPTFRKALDRCAEILLPLLGSDIRPIMFGTDDGQGASGTDRTTGAGDAELLNSTQYTQPALFAIEYALVELWRSWGVEPDALMGHSVGEYVAACVAGVFSLEDGLKLIAARGRLMQALPQNGTMAAVFASAEHVGHAIAAYTDQVSIAAINGPTETVISGERAAVAAVLEHLQSAGIKSRPLNVSHAFHSPLMEPMLDEFERVAAEVTYAAPRLRLISNVTGQAVKGRAVSEPGYWRRHVREAVRFSDGLLALREHGYEVFVEIGPKPTLLGMASKSLPDDAGVWLPSLRAGEDNWQQILRTLATLITLGVPVNWAGFDRDYPRQRVLLPTYPWQRQEFWFEPPKTSRRPSQPRLNGPSLHPLLGQRVHAPLPTFAARLTADALPLLEEYRLHGLALLPPAAYLEIALVAAREARAAEVYGLAGLTLHEPLILAGTDARTLQVIVLPGDAHTATVQIFSQPDTDAAPDTPWALHATATISLRRAEASVPLDTLATVQMRCAEQIAGAAYYERFRERGLDYGARFQALAQVWRRDGEALGQLQPPQALASDIHDFLLHPALLDACLQVAEAALPTAQLQPLATLIPAGMERVVEFAMRAAAPIYQPAAIALFQIYQPDLPAWSHATLRASEPGQPLSLDVTLLNAAGQVVAEALDVRVTPTSRDTLRRALPHDVGDWMYELEWQPLARPAAQPVPAAAPERWLIFADRAGLGAALAERLRAQGHQPLLVRHGPANGPDGQDWQVDPSDPRGMHTLLDALVPAGAAALRAAVHLWSLDTPAADQLTPAELEAAQALGCESVLLLTQALAALPPEQAPRLWLVTRAAQPAGAPAPLALAQTPLWGLGRVVALEQTEIWGGMIDLDPAAPADEAAALLAEIHAGDGEDQLALRGSQRLVARLVRRPAAPPALPTRLRPDATYLLTGGLGGLGLELARWMVERGARHLVLTSRRGLPARDTWAALPSDSPLHATTAAILELEARGAHILPAAADASDPAATAALLARIRASHPPLRGVVHAAGITRPQTIGELRLDVLREVMRPKLAGAWSLHQLTRDLELDFFVAFSSISSVWGSAALGNYAAANHFLDALAHHRRAAGLPALAVNWGPWAEVGMTAAPEEQAWLSLIGMFALPTADALAALERLLDAGRPQATVAEVDWARFKPIYEARARRPLLALLAEDEQLGDKQSAESQAVFDQIKAIALAERPVALTAYLQQRFARVLRQEPEQIEPSAHFMQFGMDSLMVMEVLNHCKRDLQLMLYPREFFEHPSLSELAAYLAQEFERHHGDASAVPAPAPAAGTGRSMLVAPGATHKRPIIAPEERNPGIVFLLSSPRTGSTLLRVMLEGHPDLFCPPELHLLPFDTMTERNQAMGMSFMGEGLERALMELRGTNADDIKTLISSLNQDDTTIQRVYRMLQDLAGERLVVDKSPSYAASMDTLERAEALFDRPKYIHLIRHPYAVIESFVRVRIDRIFSSEGDSTEIAEQVWTTLNENILTFLQRVAPERHHLVRYEDLVADPARVMRNLCAFLGVPFDDAVLNPYQGSRMTDGVRSASLSIGDPNFHNHDKIDPALGEVWRAIRLPRLLTPATQAVAARLGYELPVEQEQAGAPSASEAAAAVFAEWLERAPSPACWAFLEQHALRPDTARRFGLGYAPAGPDALVQALTQRGIAAASLETAGLALRDPAGALTDRFRERLIFPIRDAEGALIGFMGRALGSQAGQPDLYSPAEARFDQVLYGLDQARAAIKQENQAVVAEDYMDVIAAHQAGFAHFVTSPGTGAVLTMAQVGLLQPLTDLAVGFTLKDAPEEQPVASTPGVRPVRAVEGYTFKGQLAHHTMLSPALHGRAVSYTLLLPQRAPAGGAGLPLMIFLQGAERTNSDQLSVLLDRMIAEGMLNPMAIVTVSAERSLYVNRHDGSANWEDVILEDLLADLQQHLGARLDRRRIGLLGGSMGGLGALRMAFKRPELFAAVSAHAPAMEPGMTYADVPRDSVLAFLRPRSLMESLFGAPVDADGYWTANNPSYLAVQNAERIRQSGLRIALDCGTADSMAFDGVMFLHQTLEQAGIAHSLSQVPDGRHNRAYFSVALLQGFQFLSEQLARPGAPQVPVRG